MDCTFSRASCSEVFHGDFFSVFCDKSRFYWVASNDFPSVFNGPFSLELAHKIMLSSNEYFNSLNMKGV